MKRKSAIHQSLLYRYRYVIAVVVLTLLAAFMVGYKFWCVPSGLTGAEVQSAALSGGLSVRAIFSSFASGDWANYVVSLPWTVLQKASIALLGPTVLAFRLPSVILMLLSALLGIVLLRKLTRPNLAMIGGFLMVSSAFYIGIGRSGTGAAMTTFLLTAVLLLGYNLINQAKSNSWTVVMKLGLVVVMALLAYMPGGVYLDAALFVVAMLHPRIRLVLMQHKASSILYIVLLLAMLLPITIAIVNDTSIIKPLLLIGDKWQVGNIGLALRGYAGTVTDMVGPFVVPMLTIVDLILVVIGLVSIVRAMSSVRAFTVIIMGFAILIMSFARPTLIYLLFIPSTILETIGMGWLINCWYSLFPRNPYARTFAIIPLTVLIVSVGWLNINRYFNSLNYCADIAYQYDYEYLIVQRELAATKKPNDVAVVVDSEPRLYKMLANKYGVNILVNGDKASKQDKSAVKKQLDENRYSKVIVTRSSGYTPKDMKLVKVMSGWTSQNPATVLVYSK